MEQIRETLFVFLMLGSGKEKKKKIKFLREKIINITFKQLTVTRGVGSERSTFKLVTIVWRETRRRFLKHIFSVPKKCGGSLESKKNKFQTHRTEEGQREELYEKNEQMLLRSSIHQAQETEETKIRHHSHFHKTKRKSQKKENNKEGLG